MQPPNYVFLKSLEETSFRDEWDWIHQRLRCCGFVNYIEHKNYQKNATTTCVPESCCVDINEEGGCTQRQTLMDCTHLETQKKSGSICSLIYTQGCLEILSRMYKRELKTELLIFGLFEVLIVLGEIVSCALASAYVAQITRRQKSYYWNDPGATQTLRGHQPMQMSGIAAANEIQ